MAKKIKAGSYEIGRLIDQSGGMNNAVYPALLNDNEAKLLKNISLDEKGTIKTCKGRQERFAESFSTEPINGMTTFYPDTATSRLVIGSGTKLYVDTPHLLTKYDSQADWETGTMTGIDTTTEPDKIIDNSEPIIDTVTADFEAGTLTDVIAVDDKVILTKDDNSKTYSEVAISGVGWHEIDVINHVKNALAHGLSNVDIYLKLSGEYTDRYIIVFTKEAVANNPILTIDGNDIGSLKDTYINAGSSNTNYGTDTLMYIGKMSYSARTLISFSLSGITDVTTATLKLYINTTKGSVEGLKIQAYKLTRADWEETEATWNIYKTGSNWTTAGGDYAEEKLYKTSGNIVSAEKEVTLTPLSFPKLAWTAVIPDNATLTVKTRALTGEAWSEWAEIAASGDTIPDADGATKLQYKFEFATTKTTSAPELSEVSILAGGVWLSPTIDISNANDGNSGKIIYDGTTDGVIGVYTKTSADGVEWSDWLIIDAEGSIQSAYNTYIQIGISLYDKASIQELTMAYDDTPKATELATGFTAGGQFYFTTLLSTLIITNKLDAPRKWDGANDVAALGGEPPHGQYTETHKNYTFMAHTTANPSRIYWSDLLSLETWGALSYIDISPDDGDWITGLLPLADYLIITKQRSVWVLVGDGPSTFEVRRIHDGIGCIAPRSLAKMDSVFSFVGTGGIYLSDLNIPVVITERLLETWDGLNKRKLIHAASIYYNHKLRISLPDGSSTNNNIRIIYDNIRKAMYLQAFAKHASCYAVFTEAGQEILLYGHSTEGQVSRADFGTTDAGEPITMEWITKGFNFGSSAVEKKVRKLYLVCVPASSDTELKIYLVVDGVEDEEPLSVTIPGSVNDNEITIKLNPRDIDVRKIRTLGYRITQSTTNGGVQIHELLQEFRVKKVKAT